VRLVKIGAFYFTEKELKQIFEEQKYICTNSKVYHVMYSPAQQGFYGFEYNIQSMSKKGVYTLMTGQEINTKLGYELLGDNY
jgi:hypothetical protein